MDNITSVYVLQEQTLLENGVHTIYITVHVDEWKEDIMQYEMLQLCTQVQIPVYENGNQTTMTMSLYHAYRSEYVIEKNFIFSFQSYFVHEYDSSRAVLGSATIMFYHLQ